jgi:hypothetical protein
MNNSTASRNEFPSMSALKLTMFTSTQIATATHCTAIETKTPANAQNTVDSNCIALNEALRKRLAEKRHNQNLMASVNDGAKAGNWRIPFPTNDNMSPLRA